MDCMGNVLCWRMCMRECAAWQAMLETGFSPSSVGRSASACERCAVRVAGSRNKRLRALINSAVPAPAARQPCCLPRLLAQCAPPQHKAVCAGYALATVRLWGLIEVPMRAPSLPAALAPRRPQQETTSRRFTLPCAATRLCQRDARAKDKGRDARAQPAALRPPFAVRRPPLHTAAAARTPPLLAAKQAYLSFFLGRSWLLWPHFFLRQFLARGCRRA